MTSFPLFTKFVKTFQGEDLLVKILFKELKDICKGSLVNLLNHLKLRKNCPASDEKQCKRYSLKGYCTGRFMD